MGADSTAERRLTVRQSVAQALVLAHRVGLSAVVLLGPSPRPGVDRHPRLDALGRCRHPDRRAVQPDPGAVGLQGSYSGSI